MKSGLLRVKKKKNKEKQTKKSDKTFKIYTKYRDTEIFSLQTSNQLFWR